MRRETKLDPLLSTAEPWDHVHEHHKPISTTVLLSAQKMVKTTTTTTTILSAQEVDINHSYSYLSCADIRVGTVNKKNGLNLNKMIVVVYNLITPPGFRGVICSSYLFTLNKSKWDFCPIVKKADQNAKARCFSTRSYYNYKARLPASLSQTAGTRLWVRVTTC